MGAGKERGESFFDGNQRTVEWRPNWCTGPRGIWFTATKTFGFLLWIVLFLVCRSGLGVECAAMVASSAVECAAMVAGSAVQVLTIQQERQPRLLTAFTRRFANVFFVVAAKVTFQSGFARTAAGSIMAGVVAGYLSHIPHNVSTLKLLEVKMPWLWSAVTLQSFSSVTFFDQIFLIRFFLYYKIDR